METIGRLVSRYGTQGDKWVHVNYQSNTNKLSVDTASGGEDLEEHPGANWSRLIVKQGAEYAIYTAYIKVPFCSIFSITVPYRLIIEKDVRGVLEYCVSLARDGCKNREEKVRFPTETEVKGVDFSMSLVVPPHRKEVGVHLSITFERVLSISPRRKHA
jgi:hypothetical protein